MSPTRAECPPLRCIECAAKLSPDGADELRCIGCGRGFPIIAGIADLRPPLDGFDWEADRLLAVELDAQRASLPFGELLERYWAAQPAVDPRLVGRYVRGDLIGGDRASEVALQIEDLTGELDGRIALELGCGTAALGSVLARQTAHMVVTDIELSWLVLARQRVEEVGVADKATLVACTADRLPFEPSTFDLVVAADVIEHVPDAPAMVSAAYRVLRPGGTLWLSTPNRFSLTPEPHVRLWGVGFLPRGAAIRYVRRFRHIDYRDVRTLSLPGLRKALRSVGAGDVDVQAPRIPSPVRAGYRRSSRALIDVYDVARRLPVAARVVRAVSPLFHAVLRKPPENVR